MSGQGNPSFKSPLWRQGFSSTPNAIWRADDLSAHAKLLFVCLTFHAFEKGRAWPGQPRLATETGLSRSSVKRALRELETSGLVEIVRREKNQSNLYYLHPDVLAEGVTGHPEPGGGVHPDPSEGFTLNPEEEEVEEEEDTPLRPPTGDNGSILTLSGKIEKVWNHYCNRPGKTLRELPHEERMVIKAALDVATVDELCTAISACFQSDFHMKRGKYRDRDGGKYDKLTQIIKGRQGKETTRERIDFWLEREETTGFTGSGVPSADPAVIARRKQDVQRGHRLLGDEMAVRKATEAEAWLLRHGIVTTREGDGGYPTFRDANPDELLTQQ